MKSRKGLGFSNLSFNFAPVVTHLKVYTVQLSMSNGLSVNEPSADNHRQDERPGDVVQIISSSPLPSTSPRSCRGSADDFLPHSASSRSIASFIDDPGHRQ
jgi:hypothetical protein